MFLQIIHFNGMFHYKLSILGMIHLWKPPLNSHVILSLFDMLKENSPCRLSFRRLRIQVCPPEEFQHIFWEDPQLRELVKEVFPQCLEMRRGRGNWGWSGGAD